MFGGKPSSTVYVGNLSWATTEEQLLEFAAGQGAISVEIKRHSDTKRSKGWGVIHFESPEQAEAAVLVLNTTQFNGREVHVRIDTESNEPDPDGATSIYIGNLGWQISDLDLVSAFTTANHNPYYCRVMRNMSGRSRGFAIMKFKTPQEATDAIAAMNTVEVGGRPIECRYDRGRTVDITTKRSVYVGKINPEMTSEGLAILFAEAGTVKSCRARTRLDGSSRGWGIVRFETHAEAGRAIELFNGKVLDEGGAALQVRYDHIRNGRTAKPVKPANVAGADTDADTAADGEGACEADPTEDEDEDEESKDVGVKTGLNGQSKQK